MCEDSPEKIIKQIIFKIKWLKGQNTFFIPCTKAFAEPIAETHSTTPLHKISNGVLVLIFPTSKKCVGDILVKKIGRDFLTSRIINLMSLRLCSETCAKLLFQHI